MPNNRLTLYSSGMADFVRSYIVPRGESLNISIPFQQGNIADVLGSLRILGRVRLENPPSFTPENVNSGVIEINPARAQRDLLKSLSGTDLKVVAGNVTLYGRLIGVDERKRHAPNGEVIEETFLTLLSNGSIRRILLDNIDEYTFTDDKVQGEISKALDINYQKIKKDSTFVTLGLKSLDDATGDEVASIQYMVPVAAPKPSYRLSVGKDGGATMELLAVVDNNTDEDWDEFLITIANGHPISFSTDLATVRIPERSHVDIVSKKSIGAHSDGEDSYLESFGADRKPNQVVRALGAKQADYTSGVSNVMNYMAPAAMATELKEAVRDDAETMEVGDFQLFQTRNPMTIKARKSALIPIFTERLNQAGVVLVYKPERHGTRPFRAVRFVNTTGKSLAKGVCSVFQDNINVGEGILEECKPGDMKLVPHQLETGVRVGAVSSQVKPTLTHVRFADGFYCTESIFSAETEYVIRNKKDEEFRLHLEVVNQLGVGSELGFLQSVPEGARIDIIPGGWRVSLTLPPRGDAKESKTKFKVVESRREQSQIVLNERNFLYYFNSQEFSLKERLIKGDPLLSKAIACQSEIESLEGEIKSENQERETMIQMTQRVSGYLKNAPEGEQRASWLRDLEESEKSIREIERVLIPNIEKRLSERREYLKNVLNEIAAEWKLEVEPVVVTN